MYKVLIVDDDETVRYVLRQLQGWKLSGFTVEDEAGNGKEALIKLAAKNFDLVITDIRMPGMDGLRLVSEIKAKNLDACLILLSTFNDFEYAQQGIRLGVFDYMIKPVGDDALMEALERVKRHLNEKRLQEDNLEFYYPESQEVKLTDLVLAGSREAMDVATSICLEIFNLTDGNLVKTGILLEKMILNLSNGMYKVFPYLEAFEKPAFNGIFINTESLAKVNGKFLSCIKIMLEIIKKYELHHADSVVKKICTYVMTHVEEDIKLDDIAKEIYISGGYISKLFKEKTGSNFNDYVTKVKMEHAKYLLGTGKYKNYEISDKLAYSSPDYFCRLFKDYTGYTPFDFKKLREKTYNI
ncbi:MAG TPA: response regulator [Methylomusa anaerophila]|uniref:Putative response regulatory protein n=1 Tax=Methylomusa anaerophila TaxID=1930071 RepID=A0A348ANN2_9FIRM|nr:response regulator [Methylomusa anaerophila]BBB92680.1 putative response regulatory protein [Methylomusa anaerophila]HML87467.1 response regulator [Methylomusa anaerophila]